MKDNINFYSNPMDYTPSEEEIEEEITRSLEWDLFKEEEHSLFSLRNIRVAKTESCFC